MKSCLLVGCSQIGLACGSWTLARGGLSESSDLLETPRIGSEFYLFILISAMSCLLVAYM